MARPHGTKYIQTPELMWQLFLQYKENIKGKPFLIQDFVGKDGDEVYRKKEQPLTFEGFKRYCWDVEIGCVEQYFKNQDKDYDEFLPICSCIKNSIRENQITGGLVGVFNPSITQRLNGLAEQSEITQKPEQPLFGD